MKGKTYKVDLLPEDFENSDFFNPLDCALTRAATRHFNCEEGSVSCTEIFLHIFDYAASRNFKVVNRFNYSDWLYVREKYRDLNHDTIYFVTLKEI